MGMMNLKAERWEARGCQNRQEAGQRVERWPWFQESRGSIKKSNVCEFDKEDRNNKNRYPLIIHTCTWTHGHTDVFTYMHICVYQLLY